MRIGKHVFKTKNKEQKIENKNMQTETSEWKTEVNKLSFGVIAFAFIYF